jgi:hypothetical protein
VRSAPQQAPHPQQPSDACVDGPACIQPYVAEAAESAHGRLAPTRPPGNYGPPVCVWLGPNQPTERTEVKFHDVYDNQHTVVFDPKP